MIHCVCERLRVVLFEFLSYLEIANIIANSLAMFDFGFSIITMTRLEFTTKVGFFC